MSFSLTFMLDISQLPWLQALETNKKHVAVEELESLLGDNREALILDLGAGTGIIGKYVSVHWLMKGEQQRGAVTVWVQFPLFSCCFRGEIIGWCYNPVGWLPFPAYQRNFRTAWYVRLTLKEDNYFIVKPCTNSSSIITRNERKVGHPITNTDTNCNAIWFTETVTMPGRTVLIGQLRRHILRSFLVMPRHESVVCP